MIWVKVGNPVGSVEKAQRRVCTKEFYVPTKRSICLYTYLYQNIYYFIIIYSTQFFLLNAKRRNEGEMIVDS